jgi:CheY-like chemotaxis protein
VEDNPVNQLLVRQQLERLGHRPTIVGTALEGLECLRDGHEFDLVLMDWQLPDVDGLEATRRIRERERISSAHVPVVAMTASAMPEDRLACINAGMDDFMAKPVGLEALAQMVDKWTDSTASVEDDASRGAVDVEALATLQRELDDPELVASLVERFLDELHGRAEGFEAAVRHGDLDSLHRIAHTLKSTSELMGALELRDVCREAERIEDPDGLGDIGARFRQSAHAAESQLRRWLEAAARAST